MVPAGSKKPTTYVAFEFKATLLYYRKLGE